LQRVGVARAPERGQASAQAIQCPRADAIPETPDYRGVVGKCDEAVCGVEREPRRHLLWGPDRRHCKGVFRYKKKQELSIKHTDVFQGKHFAHIPDSEDTMVSKL
jgi:hypothetical protein